MSDINVLYLFILLLCLFLIGVATGVILTFQLLGMAAFGGKQ